MEASAVARRARSIPPQYGFTYASVTIVTM